MFFVVIYLVFFHLLLLLMLWSFFAVINARPSLVPPQVCLKCIVVVLPVMYNMTQTPVFCDKIINAVDNVAYNSNSNNNSNSHDSVDGAVIIAVPWQSCHCESSPDSFDECSTSSGCLSTFGPSQSAWASYLPKLAAVVLHYYSLPSHGG